MDKALDMHPIIEALANDFKDVLKKDLRKYKNHVYRVYHACMMLDEHHYNSDKYAIAGFFHDLGIWTETTFDYLAPSIQLAKEYLRKINHPEWEKEIALMIDMHHKKSTYTGDYESTVEIFRKADWIDVSMGQMRFSLRKKEIKLLKKHFPYLGFHRFLAAQTLKHFVKNPSNPLPMFKK